MRSLAAAVLVTFAALSLLPAQDANALAERERELAGRMVPGLHALADALQAERQHLRALELRREIWLEYAPDDDKARQKCGFVRVGDQWRRDHGLLVIERDLKGDPKVLKKLDQQTKALHQDALAAHRALAAGWARLGDEDRAHRHWQRVLRFAPGDAEATRALALQPFEGFEGTADDVAMLRRARTIRGACDWLRRTDFPAAAIEDQHPLLAAAKVPHQCVRSEHFTVWGTRPPADLLVLAADCERALLLAHTLFGAHGGSAFVPARRRDLVFLVDPAHYAAVLDACADQFDAARLHFLKNDVDQAFVDSSTGPLRVHKAHLALEASRDQAVRGVVQDAAGVLTDGLYEGLGHAACGFLFGRTLTFLLEQRRDRTAASWQQRTLAPELEVWMQIAEESAWAKSDTRTSELVLISAARFSTEQRVKAWAICHYLLHRRPELLLELDRSRDPEVRTAPDVEAEFLRRTSVELPAIDRDWREFWGRGGALRRAMAVDPAGDEKAKDREARLRARTLADAVNAARAAARRGPIGYFLAVGPEVAAAAKFDQQLASAEQQRQRKPKADIALPEPPAAIGTTVLWSRAKEAPAAVAEWLQDPAVRDRLLHPGRELVGASTHAPAWLLDLAVAPVDTRTGPPLCWPRAGQRDVPGGVRVRDLGPRPAAAVAAAGRQPDDLVGTAVSLHFARVVEPAVLAQVECIVRVAGNEVGGVLVRSGEHDAPSRAGWCAFVPLTPLPAGAEVVVHWTLPAGMLGEDEVFQPVAFRVR